MVLHSGGQLTSFGVQYGKGGGFTGGAVGVAPFQAVVAHGPRASGKVEFGFPVDYGKLAGVDRRTLSGPFTKFRGFFTGEFRKTFFVIGFADDRAVGEAPPAIGQASAGLGDGNDCE